MTTPAKFPCTIVHTGLFPTPLLDPFNPLKVEIVVEVSEDKLSFLSSRNQSKVLGSEPTNKINQISVHLLSVSKRRLEVLQRSLIRMGLVAAIAFLWSLLFNGYGLLLSFKMGLVVACFIGLLNFTLNGGFSIKGEVFRFQFIPEETGNSFYLNVAPQYEPELHQALHSAGLRFDDENESQNEWYCQECGETVDEAATQCPHCGAALEE